VARSKASSGKPIRHFPCGSGLVGDIQCT
jgi:hypothetical protein